MGGRFRVPSQMLVLWLVLCKAGHGAPELLIFGENSGQAHMVCLVLIIIPHLPNNRSSTSERLLVLKFRPSYLRPPATTN